MVILRSGRDTVNQSVEICSICLEDINNNVSWSLNCHHRFHKKCLRNHFLASLRQYDNFVPECPNCRNPICGETNYDSETSIKGDEPEPIPILEYLDSIGFDNNDALRHYFQWKFNVFEKIEIICKWFVMMCVEVHIITEERLSFFLSRSTTSIFNLAKDEFPKFSSNEVELVRKIIGYSLRQSKFGIPLPKFRDSEMLQTIMSTTYTYACSRKLPLTIESIVRIDNGMVIHLTYASDGPTLSINFTLVLSNANDSNKFTIERELVYESDQATIVTASFKLLNSDNGAIVNGASFEIQCFVTNNRGDSLSSNVIACSLQSSNVIACSLQSRASEFNNNSYSQS